MSKKIEYKYGRYYVQVCDNVLEEGTLNVRGYGVFNKETGVREYSDIALVNCVNMARSFELHLREVLQMVEKPGDSLFDKGTSDEKTTAISLEKMN